MRLTIIEDGDIRIAKDDNDNLYADTQVRISPVEEDNVVLGMAWRRITGYVVNQPSGEIEINEDGLSPWTAGVILRPSQ